MDKPIPTVEQIASDRRYLETSKDAKTSAIGSRCRLLNSHEDFGKKRSGDRWYRVWRKTDQGWLFERMQFGRNPIS